MNTLIPLFYTIRDYLPFNAKILIFNALAALQLTTYGIKLYGKFNSIWFKQLQSTQNQLQLKLTNYTRILKYVLDLYDLRTQLIVHNYVHYKVRRNIVCNI